MLFFYWKRKQSFFSLKNRGICYSSVFFQVLLSHMARKQEFNKLLLSCHGTEELNGTEELHHICQVSATIESYVAELWNFWVCLFQDCGIILIMLLNDLTIFQESILYQLFFILFIYYHFIENDGSFLGLSSYHLLNLTERNPYITKRIFFCRCGGRKYSREPRDVKTVCSLAVFYYALGALRNNCS